MHQISGIRWLSRDRQNVLQCAMVVCGRVTCLNVWFSISPSQGAVIFVQVENLQWHGVVLKGVPVVTFAQSVLVLERFITTVTTVVGSIANKGLVDAPLHRG